MCSVTRSSREKPYLRDILYIRGILNNRLSYYDPHIALSLLDQCVLLGASIEKLKQHAKDVANWTNWRGDVEQWIIELEKNPRPLPHEQSIRNPIRYVPLPSESSPSSYLFSEDFEYEYSDIDEISISAVAPATSPHLQ